MVITTAIIKGGAGKSTTAAALADAGAADGRKVLVLDMDAQGNLSYYLGADTGRPGTLELLHGVAVGDVLQHTTHGVDVAAASSDLAAETTRTGSARRLSAALASVRDAYDLILVDTPPTAGELTYNALYAADSVVIPLEADIAGLQGLYQIAGIIRALQDGGADAKIAGAVVTRYDGRAKLNRYMLDSIREACNTAGVPFLGAIRQAVGIKEAQAMRRQLYEYAPRCRAAEDYMELYRKLTGGSKE